MTAIQAPPQPPLGPSPQPLPPSDLATSGPASTRRASGDTCGSWGPNAPRPTTSRRRRSWPSPGPSSSNATSGRRPATCAPSPATSCWHCGGKQNREISTVELEAADSVWAAAAGPDGSLSDYLDALRDCVEQLEGRPRAGDRLALPRRRRPRRDRRATRHETRWRKNAAPPHPRAAPRMRRTKN